MRTFLTVTPIAMAAMVAAAAPALAQGTPSAPAAPAVPQVTLPRGTVTVDVKPGGSYSRRIARNHHTLPRMTASR
jgi:hypothetical protein